MARERYMMTVYAETREEQLAVVEAIDKLRRCPRCSEEHRCPGPHTAAYPGVDRDQDWDPVEED